MSIPISRLEKWSYQKEYQIFRDLYKTTGKTTWIRIPTLIATEKCTLIRTAAQIGTIVELTLNGLRLTLNPYQSSNHRQHGWVLLKNIRYKALDLIGSILVGVVISPIYIAIDPAFYILKTKVQTEVNQTYAKLDKIGSEEHENASQDTFSEPKHGHEKWKKQLENNT